MIRVEGLRFEYPGTRALDAVSFRCTAGGITALVGPNGAGKTTLLRCLAALETPDAGHIEIDGIDAIESPRQLHRRVGFLADDFGVYRELTARRCLSYAAQARGLPTEKVSARVAEVAQQVGLDSRLELPAGQLSRGQRQRLAIAQAIVHHPTLLLLDEPASGLDPDARGSLAGLLRGLAAGGMTVVVSSHILAELDEYCSDLLVLRDGRVVEHRALQQSGGVRRCVRLRVAGAGFEQPMADRLRAHDGVAALSVDGNEARFEFDGDDRALQSLLAALVDDGWPLCEFAVERERLADVYRSTVAASAQVRR